MGVVNYFLSVLLKHFGKTFIGIDWHRIDYYRWILNCIDHNFNQLKWIIILKYNYKWKDEITFSYQRIQTHQLSQLSFRNLKLVKYHNNENPAKIIIYYWLTNNNPKHCKVNDLRQDDTQCNWCE